MQTASVDRVDELAGLVSNSVAGFTTPGCYNGLHVRIDLTNPQGRWELVALALLLAARINEAVAESTFSILRNGGLLEYQRVLREDPVDAARAREILTEEYRAVIDRGRKVTAIYTNAKLLQEYGGDLNGIYQRYILDSVPSYSAPSQHSKPEAAFNTALRQLHQINVRAHWISRSMAEAGIWDKLGPACTTYYDRHVRCALHRLGLLGDISSTQVAQNNAETLVTTLFAGNTTPLYRLGRYLCLPGDPEKCRAHCALHCSCNYWQNLSSHSDACDPEQDSHGSEIGHPLV